MGQCNFYYLNCPFIPFSYKMKYKILIKWLINSIRNTAAAAATKLTTKENIGGANNPLQWYIKDGYLDRDDISVMKANLLVMVNMMIIKSLNLCGKISSIFVHVFLPNFRIQTISSKLSTAINLLMMKQKFWIILI